MNAPKPDKSSRRRTAVVASLALAGTLLAIPYMAQAASFDDPAPETGQESPAALLSEQISQAANDLYDTAHKDTVTGYSNIVVSAKDSGYTLYWKGEVPLAITNLVESQRKQGLRVSVQDANYSRTELEAKAQSIAQPGASVGGNPITSVGPSNDGNALDIAVAPSAFVIPGSQQELDALERDRSALTSLTGGIPVNISAKESATPVALKPKVGPDMTRYQESKYWTGGAGIGAPNYCTAGFTVVDPLNNIKYMTTAAHCVNKVGEVVKNGNKDTTLGKVVDIQPLNDSALIAIDPHTTGTPTVYSEYGIAGPHGMSRVVRYSGRAFVGELLCADGALTGEQCGGLVKQVGSWEWDKKYQMYRIVDKISQVAGRNMAGSGDSGGPVYAGRQSAENPGYPAYPRGVISMTFSGQACYNPIPWLGNSRLACSPDIAVTNLEMSLKMHARALNIPQLRVDTFR
ncbi:hypothetical protein [Streptomyces sp. NPDC059761]|uniref:hypothetical protein n=1 Tax=Streptomyces sp. NPDC059761 TaxID=3346937 RepID=UPI003656C773